MIENAIQNIIRLLQSDKRSWRNGSEQLFWHTCFEIIARMPGSTSKLRDIANECDRDQLQDTLAEIKYAVIFSELGFQVEIEPLGGKMKDSSNPDLRISRGEFRSIVEVKRFRSARVDLETIDIDKLGELHDLPTYGNPQSDWKKIFDEVANKFRQAGDDGIIAIWNNNGTLELEEFENVIHAHRTLSKTRLAFVVLKTDLRQPFSCFKLRGDLSPFHEELIVEIEQKVVEDILFGPYWRKRKLVLPETD